MRFVKNEVNTTPIEDTDPCMTKAVSLLPLTPYLLHTMKYRKKLKQNMPARLPGIRAIAIKWRIGCSVQLTAH